jgi:hypothetical protein
MKKLQWILLFIIILGGVFVRCYRFNNPIADWHSWRQADTSAVSRNFVKYGFDILHPKYDDISNVQSGQDNPKGYRFVEFPIINVFQASLYQTFHGFTLEEWGRVVTIVITAFGALFIFLLAKAFSNSTVGLFATAFYAFDPYSIYYGRVILPDPAIMPFLLGGMWFFYKLIEGSLKFNFKNVVYFVLSVLFIAFAILLKPFAAFFVFPFIIIVWNKWRWKLFTQWFLYIFVILSVVPFILWRLWMQQYPEGIPANTWLFNEGNIRFTGAFFYWIFAERFSKLILGYWGIAIVMIGFLNQKVKSYAFFLSFVLGTLLYVTVVARGNVQHDYYQIILLPTFAFFFGLGADFLLSFKSVNIWTRYSILAICSVFMLMFGWYQVRDYFNINNQSIVIAGKAVDTLTPKNARVLAPYDGDTSFLYQTNRQGWPSFEHDLPILIKMGADYLVIVNPKDDSIGKEYKIVSYTPDYILVDLHQKVK